MYKYVLKSNILEIVKTLQKNNTPRGEHDYDFQFNHKTSCIVSKIEQLNYF